MILQLGCEEREWPLRYKRYSLPWLRLADVAMRMSYAIGRSDCKRVSHNVRDPFLGANRSDRHTQHNRGFGSQDRCTVIPVTACSSASGGLSGLNKHGDLFDRLENPADMVRLTARLELSYT